MSDDLISRKVVMDYLREQQANVIIEQNKNNPVTYDATKGMSASVDAFMNFIAQMPTAYDVDKVVERLENAGQKMSEAKSNMPYGKSSHGCHNYYKAVSIKRAIKIVKGGGMDEQK